MNSDRFRAYPTHVTFGRPGEEQVPIWDVAGGRNFKGFGRIPRFAGTQGEAEAVAEALQRYHENLEGWRQRQYDKLRWGLQTPADMRNRLGSMLGIIAEASRLALDQFKEENWPS